jgi:hypothetical protein
MSCSASSRHADTAETETYDWGISARQFGRFLAAIDDPMPGVGDDQGANDFSEENHLSLRDNQNPNKVLPATIKPNIIRSLRSPILIQIAALSHPDCRATMR